MALAPDIPAPRGTLGLFPPEREIPVDENLSWGISMRLRKWALRSHPSRRRLVAFVRASRGSLRDLTPDALRAEAQARSARLGQGPLTIRRLADVMATVEEALFRARGFTFHDNQLQAGLVLSSGHFAEMATGEGKTLTATLPIAVHALVGCGVHVVTVNDYLAERDAEEVTPILGQLGLSVGCVLHDMSLEEKRAAYSCDVTYCANKELVFDYLKERARWERPSPLGYRLQLAGLGDEFRTTQPLVQALDFVLIDEADSVLIDEANIPLILTEPVDHKLSEAFVAQAIDLVARAADDVWENADTLGYRGLRPEALARLIDSLTDPAPEWQSLAVAEEMISKARLAQDKFSRDVHYIIEDKKIVLVDAQTGRPTPEEHVDRLEYRPRPDRVDRGLTQIQSRHPLHAVLDFERALGQLTKTHEAQFAVNGFGARLQTHDLHGERHIGRGLKAYPAPQPYRKSVAIAITYRQSHLNALLGRDSHQLLAIGDPRAKPLAQVALQHDAASTGADHRLLQFASRQRQASLGLGPFGFSNSGLGPISVRPGKRGTGHMARSLRLQFGDAQTDLIIFEL